MFTLNCLQHTLTKTKIGKNATIRDTNKKKQRGKLKKALKRKRQSSTTTKPKKNDSNKMNLFFRKSLKHYSRKSTWPSSTLGFFECNSTMWAYVCVLSATTTTMTTTTAAFKCDDVKPISTCFCWISTWKSTFGSNCV